MDRDISLGKSWYLHFYFYFYVFMKKVCLIKIIIITRYIRFYISLITFFNVAVVVELVECIRIEPEWVRML